MKILMLGWEYPPHIAGGLGTACQGLTRGLSRQGVEIQFLMPYVYGDEDSPHMTIIDPERIETQVAAAQVAASMTEPEVEALITRYAIPAYLMPYWTNEEYRERVAEISKPGEQRETLASATQAIPGFIPTERAQYGSGIFGEVGSFTRTAVLAGQILDFDVIHAHDWMTFPAAVALRDLTGKPLVVHVHSLEFDRSGHHANDRINQIEGLGVTQADAVIAVSYYTKQIVCRQHGVSAERVHVVHNGIYPKEAVEHYREARPPKAKHLVLFLGRVTFQKGPDYFVRAAAKVIPHVPDVQFVLAGSGDMLEQVKHLAQELHIEDRFSFPGFLKGKAVEEMFSVADLYIMPSVSEPFGISVLEAINFDVPTLISRQSGVAEVVDHSLKFDFWDVERLADLIINALEYEELREDMIDHARRELGKLRWDAAASKTITVYNQVLN